MDVWVTAKVVYSGDSCWNKILSTHKTKEEAIKCALEKQQETEEKIYYGIIIVKENRS